MTEADRRCAWLWMNYRVKKFAGKDLPLFPFELLPETGITAVNQQGEALAVAFLYIDKKAPIAVCGWCAANPENTLRTSREAVETVLRKLPEYAKECGAGYLLSTFGNRRINAMLREIGFVYGEQAETMLMRVK